MPSSDHSDELATTSASGLLRSRSYYLLAGILIGAVFLAITLRHVDLADAVSTFYNITAIWLIPLTVIYIANLALRGFRWWLMFPQDIRPSFRHAMDAFLIGKVGNNIMPGRLGELIRASIIGRHLPQMGVSGSLMTVVLEKLFDALAILAFLGIALLIAPLPDWVYRVGWTMVIVFPILIIVLAAFDRVQQGSSSPVYDSSSLYRRAKNFAWKLIDKVSMGLHTLRTAQHFTYALALSLLIWAGEVVVMYLCMLAFNISAPFSAALVATVFLCLGTILPAAPGFVGTYQLFIVAGLQMYNVPHSDAFALAVFLNLYMIVMTTVFGVIALLLDGGVVSLRQLLQSTDKSA